jgi:hypothetical protein
MSISIIIENNLNVNVEDILYKILYRKHIEERFTDEYKKEKEIINKENNKYNYPENISKNFICPISYDIFYNPVITCDGQTYEKMDILRWFMEGNETSPLTGKKLESLEIVPNIVLKNVIDEWKKQYLKNN